MGAPLLSYIRVTYLSEAFSFALAARSIRNPENPEPWFAQFSCARFRRRRSCSPAVVTEGLYIQYNALVV